MENETVKTSTLADAVSDAVKASMAMLTERLEKTEKKIAELQECIEDMQSSLSALAAKNVSGSSQSAWNCDSMPNKKARTEHPGSYGPASNASTRASSAPSSAGGMNQDGSDPRRVWFLGFPRPLPAGMMKAAMKQAVVATCGECAAKLKGVYFMQAIRRSTAPWLCTQSSMSTSSWSYEHRLTNGSTRRIRANT